MRKLTVSVKTGQLHIAWRINRLMRLGRTVPELDAGLVFEPDECKRPAMPS